jgi:sec-independent protein translocase protein TatC
MPVGKARMPFLEHLSELRRRLFIVVVSLAVLTIAGYFFSTALIDFVLAPVRTALPDGGSFVINQSPIDAMTLRFKAGFYLALLVDSPLIIWQVMAFFLPALKPKERRYVVPTFMMMVALFLTGIAFCYTLVLAPGFTWLLEQGVGLGEVLAQVATYFDMAMVMLIVFGVAFQLPVIVFYLLIFNIVPYKTLRKNWRVVYLTLLATAAFGVPDWSPVTNLGLWAALIVLYEASMLLARIVLNRRLKKLGELEGEEPELETDAVEAEA